MDGVALIQDLAIVLLAAGIAGVVCRRIGLSVIVGYLVAGVVVGPHTPPFALVSDIGRIQTLSQVGLVFLMFGIGLGLSISKIGRMGWTTLVATGVGALLMLSMTQLVGRLAGWTSDQSLFLAAMFMVSSSAVIAKLVGELNLTHDRSGQMALSITVLEDVVAVVMLTILAAKTGGPGANLGTLITGMTTFVVLLVGAGLLMIPRLIRRLEARADPELQTIIVAGMLFLLAMSAAKAGYSLALGAFLLGAIVAEIPQKMAVEKAFTGMRDLFSSVFFVSIGMMIDVRLLAQVWKFAVALGLFALVGRMLATSVALILCGTRANEARRAGLLLGPLGEFSFIIAQLGVSSHVFPDTYYPLAVGVSLLTVLLVPIVNRFAGPVLGLAERLEPRWVNRAVAGYHGWLSHIRNAGSPSVVWKLIRGRLVQIGLEVLLVTGVMTFSRPVLAMLLRNADAFGVSERTLGYVFWAAVSLLVLIPLVAIWRNVAAVSLIVAESLSRGRMTPPMISTAVKSIGALLLGYWLYAILPMEQLGARGWMLIGGAAVIVVAVFSSRLIYLHSHWQSTVRDVLAEDASGGTETPITDEARARRDLGLQQWNVKLGECVIPDGASYAGQSLAQLAIPTRYGCAVLELERNGIVITAIRPDLRLYPGDKLLLLGRDDQIAAAREFLTRETVAVDQADEFRGSVLETFALPHGPYHGRTLAELRLSQVTGVRVVGIERGGTRIIAPSGEEQLREGDHVLVAGTLAEIARFRRWLAEQQGTVAQV